MRPFDVKRAFRLVQGTAAHDVQGPHGLKGYGMTKLVGIIGTGMIGGAIARLSAAAGLNVIIANSRGPDSLRDFVDELGPRVRAETAAAVATTADLVVAAVPLGAYRTLPPALLAGTTVIDTMNYYPSRDSRFPDIDAARLTTSEMVQQHLSDSQVVKALYNLDFHHLLINARPHGDGERTTLPIAGDNGAAKQQVADFMDRIGYDSVDVGPLSESWRVEPGTPVYVWPYVPVIPEGLDEAARNAWYRDHSGPPVSADAVRDMAARAERTSPVGGFTDALPPEHIAFVKEVYSSRQ